MSNFATYIYSFMGIMALFYTALRYTNSRQLNSRTVKIGEYCFGVYLFQQFILQAVYFHSSIPLLLQSKLLPWCGFLFTLIVSLLFSYLLKFTTAGKRLL